jgi:hypothetical protein
MPTADEIRLQILKLLEKKEKEKKRKDNKSSRSESSISKKYQCVKWLFGLCKRNCPLDLRQDEPPCFEPATVIDKVVLHYLVKQSKFVPSEVIEKAKFLWLKEEREKYKPFDITLHLILKASKEIEQSKLEENTRKKQKINPDNWIVYF